MERIGKMKGKNHKLVWDQWRKLQMHSGMPAIDYLCPISCDENEQPIAFDEEEQLIAFDEKEQLIACARSAVMRGALKRLLDRRRCSAHDQWHHHTYLEDLELSSPWLGWKDLFGRHSVFSFDFIDVLLKEKKSHFFLYVDWFLARKFGWNISKRENLITNNTGNSQRQIWKRDLMEVKREMK